MVQEKDRLHSWNTALTAKPGDINLHISTENIVGIIPTSIRGGRLLSNGPGWNQYGDINLHPFDGHGYLRSFFSFNEDGSLSVKARFIETESYLLEKETETFTVRGFATNPHDQSGKTSGIPSHEMSRTRPFIAGEINSLPDGKVVNHMP